MSLSRLCVPLLLLPLFGCGPDRDAFAPLCPSAKLVPELAELTRWSGPGPAHDVTDLILQAQVTSVNGSCQTGDNPALVPAKVQVAITVQRGPAMKGREADVPVFLAVLRGSSVRDKKIFPVHVVFPPNVDRLVLGTDDIDMDLPVSKDITGAAYSVIAGFQLTPDELAANRHPGGG